MDFSCVSAKSVKSLNKTYEHSVVLLVSFCFAAMFDYYLLVFTGVKSQKVMNHFFVVVLFSFCMISFC